MRILIRVLPSRLLPAFIGSDLLATTGRSSISQPIDLAFSLRLCRPYLFAFASRRLRDFPQLSAHSIPSILTLITSMSLAGHNPLFVFLKGMPIRIGFPVLQAGHPTSPPPLVHRIPGWTLPAGSSDSLSRETPCLSFFLMKLGHPLRLRHFKGQSYRVDLNHLDCATVRRTIKARESLPRHTSFSIK